MVVVLCSERQRQVRRRQRGWKGVMERERVIGTERHPYHLVDPSPWPIVTATGALGVVTGGVWYMHYGRVEGLWMGMIIMLSGMGIWWRDVIREGTLEGQHTSIVQLGIRMGMMLFIASEVMFFVAFFWGFFWASLAPVPEIGSVWPPQGIEVMKAWEVPFMNTLILLSSGASVTWAHHSIVVGKREEAVKGMVMTIGLAIIFTGLQGYEYASAKFSMGDGIYGSTFYMATGFHGFHVIIGTIFLTVGLGRIMRYEMTRQHHVGFEAAAWYWHFVDVVWLFLFVSIYWWGG